MFAFPMVAALHPVDQSLFDRLRRILLIAIQLTRTEHKVLWMSYGLRNHAAWSKMLAGVYGYSWDLRRILGMPAVFREVLFTELAKDARNDLRREELEHLYVGLCRDVDAVERFRSLGGVVRPGALRVSVGLDGHGAGEQVEAGSRDLGRGADGERRVG